MEDTPNQKRKNAKSWPKTNQNYPPRQLWRHAKLSKMSPRETTRQKVNNKRQLHSWYACPNRTSENATFFININKAQKRPNWYATLSKAESCNLIGQKINKVSCIPSVSHTIHATTKGRQKSKLKTRNIKYRKSEVSPDKKLPKRTGKIRHKHLTHLGHETTPVWNPQKTNQSRSSGPSKVKNKEKSSSTKKGKKDIVLIYTAFTGTKMAGEEKRYPVVPTKDTKSSIS